MDVAQDLMYNASSYLFYATNDSIFKLIIPIESSVLLKNHVSCKFMLKYYTTLSLQQFRKTLSQFFDLSRANKNLKICALVCFL